MKNIIFLFFIIACFTHLIGQSHSRMLKTVTFSGTGYELGMQHGKALKPEIAGIIAAWKKNTSTALEKDADAVLKDFFEYCKYF